MEENTESKYRSGFPQYQERTQYLIYSMILVIDVKSGSGIIKETKWTIVVVEDEPWVYKITMLVLPISFYHLETSYVRRVKYISCTLINGYTF